MVGRGEEACICTGKKRINGEDDMDKDDKDDDDLSGETYPYK